MVIMMMMMMMQSGLCLAVLGLLLTSVTATRKRRYEILKVNRRPKDIQHQLQNTTHPLPIVQTSKECKDSWGRSTPPKF